MKYLCDSEANGIIRVGQELLQHSNIEDTQDLMPKLISNKYVKLNHKQRHETYTNKKMHGYFQKKLENDPNIDMKTSQTRSVNNHMTSQFEGYISAVQDQELPTKYLINKRDKDAGKQPLCSNKCRLCKTNVEDIPTFLVLVPTCRRDITYHSDMTPSQNVY